MSFDENLPGSEPMVNTFEIDWRQRVREECINAIQKNSDFVEEISDNDDDDDDDDDFENNFEEENMNFGEIIATLDKLKRCSVFDDVSHDMLSAITKKIEDLQLKSRKQSSITLYFN